MKVASWQFWVDTGGTFTDCLARNPQGGLLRAKVLSSSCLRGKIVETVESDCLRIEVSGDYPPNFFQGYGFRAFSAEAFQSEILEWDSVTRTVKLDTEALPKLAGCLCELVSPEEPPVLAARVLMGKRLDEPLGSLEMRLATTRGTNALLEGKGARTAFLVTKGFGDLLSIGTQQRPNLFEIGIRKPTPLCDLVIEIDERLDKDGKVIKELEPEQLTQAIAQCRANGIDSVAIALLHSYLNPDQELRIARAFEDAGFKRVAVSSSLSARINLLPRAETTVVDAYLAPIMESYLDAVEQRLQTDSLRIMTSAGGLVKRSNYRPKDSLLSGPAGGVVGSASAGRQAGYENSIAFDMGGTSTDVSRFGGVYDYQFSQKIGSAHVLAPSLRIETVAAGGGSICWFDGSAIRVGPESAGASPGPACYGAGGPLTLTDVNLLLGRLDASRFGIPVFEERARERLGELRRQILEQTGREVSEEALLIGCLGIANERMAEAILSISVRQGYDPRDYALVAFGGAGGLHSCAIAEILEMDTIVFPSDSGLLSAYGLKQALVERFQEQQVLALLDESLSSIEELVDRLTQSCVQGVLDDGEPMDAVSIKSRVLDLRYLGQDATITIPFTEAASVKTQFEEAYLAQFGYLPSGLLIELVVVRVIAVAGGRPACGETFEANARSWKPATRFMDRQQLEKGTRVDGPIVIQDQYSTVYVESNWAAEVGSKGTIRLRKIAANPISKSDVEVVQLELFTNRFLSIVEEMGALLERSSFSTNIKERKDFSCALLDRDGFLIANAPHIPVHLGALGVCLRETLKVAPIGPGDVVVTNHPAFGGSHLPDVTLMASVYTESGDLIGYVANRAHHAELGGVSPGSMPPQASSLIEEGVVIPPTYLAKSGIVDWESLKSLFLASAYPTRALNENVADLSAQLASIRNGEAALKSLAEIRGVDRVVYFMQQLKGRAARSLRKALAGKGSDSFEAIESLDNGARICVQISKRGERWRVDFLGSAEAQESNYNATKAIVTSAVIYVLRILANEEIPLNEGFLDVVDIEIPEGMLNPRFASDPSECPPVVAGNVEISQRIVDTLFKALGLAACSQGTMNNLIFGNERCSFYETIAGGEGATPFRDGASATHVHMTNTAITDPEILELRYPVRLEEFSIRHGSGGDGVRRGGDGVVRRLKFLEKVQLSLLTQHRVVSPFGMAGGACARCGEQFVEYADGRVEGLKSNVALELQSGDTLEIRTPGGGGYASIDRI